MALSNPTITGYSGFWQLTGDLQPYNFTGDANSRRGRSPLEHGIARVLVRNQFRDVAAAFSALIGAASGGTATSTYKREQAPLNTSKTVPVPTAIGDFGGNVVIETVTAINRATTAGDVSYLKDFVNGNMLERDITYPTVLGSGGGGKVGTF